MFGTDKKRFDDTIEYIRRFISPQLATNINRAMAGRTASKVGQEISLSGGGFNKTGTDAQHKALRALLLCQRVFLTAPWAISNMGTPFDYNSDRDLPKTYYKNFTEAQIKNVILNYLPGKGATREGLAAAATGIQNPTGNMVWETITRDTNPFPTMQVCFDALKMWLFKAGFVSLSWLANTGPKMTAQTVNQMLGDGEVIPESQLDNIPRGFLFNFHKKDYKAVCHWGVSLGQGWAAGANTTANELGSPAPVNFRSGGSIYGEFTLASSLLVCKYKYTDVKGQPGDVTIRQIDPALVSTYF
jgi:hypothetical protein